MQNESDKKEEMGQNMNVEAASVDDSFASPTKVWLIWASQGEYSDRREWPICAFTDEQAAKDDCLNRLFAWRAANAVGRDEDGQMPDYGTPEDTARKAAFAALGLVHDSYGYDEPSFYACEIEVFGDGGAKQPSTKTPDEVQRLNPTSSPPILQGEGNNAD